MITVAHKKESWAQLIYYNSNCFPGLPGLSWELVFLLTKETVYVSD